MIFVTDTRVRETSVTTGAGDYTLAGAPTGYQPFSTLGASNACPYWASDGTNFEEGIGTILSGPARLQRTHVMKSSNGGAAVNWGPGARDVVCGPIASLAFPRIVTKSVAGGADVVLTQLEQRCAILVLTGALTANINVIVDNTVWSWQSIYNGTSGNFSVTVKTAAGTGVAVTQGKRAALHCDGTNVLSQLSNLKSLTLTDALTQAVGAALASAATIDLTALAGNACHITGATAITAVTLAAGKFVTVIFDGILTLTHHATNNNLPGAANITTAAGDRALYWSDGTAVYCLHYQKVNGQPVSPPSVAATQAEQEAASTLTAWVSPGRQQFHPSAAKCWIFCDNGGATYASFNITSITDTGTGVIGVTIATDFSSTNYALLASGTGGGGGVATYGNITAAGAFNILSYNTATNAAQDVGNAFAAAFGDQA